MAETSRSRGSKTDGKNVNLIEWMVYESKKVPGERNRGRESV